MDFTANDSAAFVTGDEFKVDARFGDFEIGRTQSLQMVCKTFKTGFLSKACDYSGGQTRTHNRVGAGNGGVGYSLTGCVEVAEVVK